MHLFKCAVLVLIEFFVFNILVSSNMSDTEFENSSEDTNYSVPLFSEASVGPYPGTLSIRTSNLFTNAIGAQVEDDDDHVEDDSVDDDIETQSDGSNNRSSDDSTEELNDQDDESNEPEHVIRGENLFMLDPESSASSSSTDDLPLHTIANIMDVSNNTITIDQSCAHVEVVDLDSESEPSLRATAAANEDDEDVLILSENLNDTDVLHMPVLTRPTPVVTNPPTVPTVPLARRSIPFRHPYNGAIGPVIRGLARLAPSDSEEDVPRPEPYRPKRTSSTSRVTKKSKQNEDTPSARYKRVSYLNFST